jgi:hypothetical protein
VGFISRNATFLFYVYTTFLYIKLGLLSTNVGFIDMLFLSRVPFTTNMPSNYPWWLAGHAAVGVSWAATVQGVGSGTPAPSVAAHRLFSGSRGPDDHLGGFVVPGRQLLWALGFWVGPGL